MAKYQFLIEDNKVTAVSSYAGRPVQASAKCHPDDKFNVEYGKELAEARCNQKIAYKRRQRAIQKMKETQEAFEIAKRKYNKMVSYFDDSMDALCEANDKLLYVEAKAHMGN